MLSGEAFAAVLKSRDRGRSSHFSVHWLDGATAEGRLGLVVPKRLARTSVRRNLIKRQARALFGAWIRQRANQGSAGGTVSSSSGTKAPDVVVKLTAGVAGLGRTAQFTELGDLLQALPRA